MVLSFCNDGASLANQMLGMISGFSSAGTDFDGAGKFIPGDEDGTYTGSPADMKKKIQDEMDTADKRIAQLDKLSGSIDDQIKKINANPKYTAAQKKELTDKLKEQKTNATQTEASLKSLKSKLKTIQGGITPVDGKPNEFKLSGDAEKALKGGDGTPSLSESENNVIQGDAKKDPPGGLETIANGFDNMSKFYSDQGQEQQMQVQMRMTQVQQEWTIVSTAMQSLNQMYMRAAQGIGK